MNHEKWMIPFFMSRGYPIHEAFVHYNIPIYLGNVFYDHNAFHVDTVIDMRMEHDLYIIPKVSYRYDKYYKDTNQEQTKVKGECYYIENPLFMYKYAKNKGYIIGSFYDENYGGVNFLYRELNGYNELGNALRPNKGFISCPNMWNRYLKWRLKKKDDVLLKLSQDYLDKDYLLVDIPGKDVGFSQCERMLDLGKCYLSYNNDFDVQSFPIDVFFMEM